MRKTIIALAAIAASMPAAAAFADSSISPDKRPLEQLAETHQATTVSATYGYAGSADRGDVHQNLSPEKRPLGL